MQVLRLKATNQSQGNEMEITIPFDPKDVVEDDEAYPAFKAGGMALKFWVLYKHFHLTSQHFRPALENFVAYLNAMADEDSDVKPYKDIEEFYEILRGCGISFKSQWLINHWDYFNLNIQKKVIIKYKTMVEVEAAIAA